MAETVSFVSAAYHSTQHTAEAQKLYLLVINFMVGLPA